MCEGSVTVRRRGERRAARVVERRSPPDAIVAQKDRLERQPAMQYFCRKFAVTIFRTFSGAALTVFPIAIVRPHDRQVRSPADRGRTTFALGCRCCSCRTGCSCRRSERKCGHNSLFSQVVLSRTRSQSSDFCLCQRTIDSCAKGLMRPSWQAGRRRRFGRAVFGGVGARACRGAALGPATARGPRWWTCRGGGACRRARRETPRNFDRNRRPRKEGCLRLRRSPLMRNMASSPCWRRFVGYSHRLTCEHTREQLAIRTRQDLCVLRLLLRRARLVGRCEMAARG